MTGKLVFLDTETTGLDPETGQIFELAVIEEDGTEHVWTIEPSPFVVARMHPKAAEVNRYHERTSDPSWSWDIPFNGSSSEDYNRVFAEIRSVLDGAHIVGAVPDFDTRHMVSLCRTFVQPCPRWHYHLIDIESMAVGYLHGIGRGTDFSLPWKSDELSRAIGVEPPQGDDRHTALGDARWVRRMWDALAWRLGV